MQYRNKRGSLHPGLRADRAAGLLAMFYTASHRKEGAEGLTLWDFLPYEEEPPITLEQAMERWQ